MFGKRASPGADVPPAERGVASPDLARTDSRPPPQADGRSDTYFQTKSLIFGALIEAIDLSALSKLDPDDAREEIRDIVHEIVAIKNLVLSIAEQEDLLDDICNDVLGFGPLEPLLARDDIADIMVNGPTRCFIEVGGKIQLTNVRFRDNAQLMNICQRIVSQVGRRVDEASPICDARLLDGSRVNVIAPPLAIDGAALTIRKFRKDKLTLDQLVRFGSISPAGAEILKIIGRVRCNVLISGGTGSGKTTLLNCLTNYIDADERVITCEDAAELQLQQPHVVRLETRPPNLEGAGQITMRDLVKQLPAHAARADHRRRGARAGGFRSAAGDEHGPRRLDGHAARQLAARGSEPPRIDDHHGRLLAADQDRPRHDLLVDRRHHPGGPPARRLAPHHPRHRGDRDGRRRHHHPGPARLRHPRRRRAGKAEGPASLDRHRPARASGNARAYSARSSGSPPRSTQARRTRRGDAGRSQSEPAQAQSAGACNARAERCMISPILLAGGAASAVGVVALLIFGGDSRADKRRAAVQRPAGKAIAATVQVDKAQRRKQIADGLRDLEKTNRQRANLRSRIEQAGLSVSPSQFLVACAIAGLVIGAAAWIRVRQPPCRGGRPRWPAALACRNSRSNGCARRRITKFIANFPTAIDIIVRGVRSGLPLGDTIRIAAEECDEPVRGEFRKIVQATTVGLTLPEAVERMAQRVPVTETNFFSIVIAIQGKAGGNLSEAMGNLSRVLRERKKMKAKIGAMSMEAKASAVIIGVVPFLVVGALYVSSPKYISLSVDDHARPAGSPPSRSAGWPSAWR